MLPRRWMPALAGIPLLVSAFLPTHAATAAAPVQVILDGRPLALNPAPTIVDDRTLVPLRGVFEAMGANLTWDEAKRTVTVTRGSRYVRLKIDRRLACLNEACTDAATLDVPAGILTDRTYVPVRFISQAMGAKVSWEPVTRSVIIDTDKAPVPEEGVRVTIPSLARDQVIRGPVTLRAAGVAGNQVQFFLIDPATGAGPIIAVGSDTGAEYTFTPDPTITGTRLVVAAVKESSGVVRYSDPVRVVMASEPVVRLTGADYGGLVDGPITIGNDVNFVATHVKIRVINSMGAAEDLGTVGPDEQLTWYPQIGHNGSKWLQAIAYDRDGNEYESASVPVRVDSNYRAAITGIKDGAVLDRSITVRVSTNYPVEGVKYVLDDVVAGWGYSYSWDFGPEANGAHALRVDILDKEGVWRSYGPYNVTVKTSPQLWLSGVGPDQVVTGAVTLKTASNVDVTSVAYYLTDPSTGRTELLGRRAPGEPLAWTPASAHTGKRTIHAVATDAAGRLISSEKVTFRVFLGKTYGPTPLVPKSEFKDLASGLAVPAYREFGMAASLQVAQALLETGWGQSVPVDKYTGQVSYNLFGIKGTGTKGSIVSNTWEVYNGVSFRVDANFRAYRNVQESWRDHKDLLLTRSWYAPFRAVMSDPVLGAWALRKSGYATDPQYPVKLINIMKQNGLFKLDLVEL